MAGHSAVPGLTSLWVAGLRDTFWTVVIIINTTVSITIHPMTYRTNYRIIPFLVTNVINYVIFENAMAIMLLVL